MKIFNAVLVSVLTLTLYGCASPAKFENMAHTQASGRVFDNALKKEVTVKPVQGGEDTNPLWTSEISSESFQKAVEQSLASNGLLSKSGRYKLKVILAKIDQPLFGLDLTVTTHVNYVLVDSKTDKIIFNELVVTPYTATFSDAAFAVKRLRLANEGAGKKNIEGLLKKLSNVKINKRDISLK